MSEDISEGVHKKIKDWANTTSDPEFFEKQELERLAEVDRLAKEGITVSTSSDPAPGAQRHFGTNNANVHLGGGYLGKVRGLRDEVDPNDENTLPGPVKVTEETPKPKAE